MFIGGIDVGATKKMKAKASRELKKKKVAEEKEVMKNSSSSHKSNFAALDSDKALGIDSETDDKVWNPSAYLVTMTNENDQMRTNLSTFAKMCDRFKISDRAASAVSFALLNDFDMVPPDDNRLSID